MQSSFQDIFYELIEENKGQILRICHAYSRDSDEKKDLFQEVMIAIWKSLPSFEGRASASTWIYRITLNTCMRSRLKLDRHQTNHIKLSSVHFDTIPEKGDDQKEKQILLARMHTCIQQLKDTEKNIVILFLEEIHYKEIASITGVTENYVAVHMKRIKGKLLTCLK